MGRLDSRGLVLVSMVSSRRVSFRHCGNSLPSMSRKGGNSKGRSSRGGNNDSGSSGKGGSNNNVVARLSTPANVATSLDNGSVIVG